MNIILFSPPYGEFPEDFSYKEYVSWDKEYDFFQAKVRFPEGWRKSYIRERLLRFHVGAGAGFYSEVGVDGRDDVLPSL